MTLSAVDRHAVHGWIALDGVIVFGLFLVAGVWFPAPAQAHMHGMFATKAEAEKRAAELKYKGVFAMGSLLDALRQ